MDLRLISEISVETIQQVGSDEMIEAAARVSVSGLAGAPEVVSGATGKLIGYLMKSRHGTPFEHGYLTVRVHAPIKVWREWHRHRIGWSYNEESGRYKQLDPVFYVPPRDRPMIRPEGFKSARPAFDTTTQDEYDQILMHLEAGYRASYLQYLAMLEMQVDRGLARDVLGVGIYSACYCSANPRSIMAFLELRTDHPESKRPSKPLYEIRVAADKLEAIFSRYWPITYQAWIDNGRASP